MVTPGDGEEVEESSASSAVFSPSMGDDERCEARKRWRGIVFRTWEEAEDEDVLFWDSIPVEERARATWELRVELHGLASPDGSREHQICRTVVVIVRR